MINLIEEYLSSDPVKNLMSLSSFFTLYELGNPGREATGESDFVKLFDREITKLELKKIKITSEVKIYFAKESIDDIRLKLTKYKQDFDLEKRTHSLIIVAENFIDWLEKEIMQLRRLSNDFVPTHREIMFAYNFKESVGLVPPRKAADWLKERGSHCKNEYYTVSYGPKNRPVTPKELENIIKLLADFPDAQRLAITELNRL